MSTETVISENRSVGDVTDQSVLYRLHGRAEVSARILGASIDEAERLVLYEQGTPNGGSLVDPEMARDLGIRVIVPDRPGYGLSTPSRRIIRTIIGVADRHAAVMGSELVAVRGRRLWAGHMPVGVVGRSGGGLYALGALVRYPRLYDVGATLCSLAPRDILPDYTEGMTEDNKKAHDAAVPIEELIQRYEGVAAQVREDPLAILKLVMTDPRLSHTDRVDLQRCMNEMGSEHARTLAHGARGWVEDIVAAKMPVGFKLRNIEQPVVVWHGTNDPFSPPSHSKAIVDALDPKLVHDMTYAHGEGHFGGIGAVEGIFRWMQHPCRAERSPSYVDRVAIRSRSL